MSHLTALALVALLTAASPAEYEAFKAEVAQAPADVRAFIDRRVECDHWLGEEGFDPARTAQIDTAVRELNCAGLDDEEQDLRDKYDDRLRVLNLLDRAIETVW